MTDINCSISPDSSIYADSYAGVNRAQEESSDKQLIRSRFMQQSARYLGADWNSSKVQLLCSVE